jgi:predicted glycosyltransferase
MSSVLNEKGKEVMWLMKDDPVILRLSEHYGLNGNNLGKKGKGKLSKLFRQILFLYKTTLIAYKTNATLGVGVSMTLPLVSKLSSMQSICLDDDDMLVTPTFAKYANRADTLLTPAALDHEIRGENHITYQGYHELAYLHPNRFKPDPSVLQKLGLRMDETFFIIRLNAFRAHHDKGQSGISLQNRNTLLALLEKHGKVFISLEENAQS